MRKILWSIVLLLLTLSLWAQEEVQLGGHTLTLPPNMEGRVRGVTAAEQAVQGCENILVQLKKIPDANEIAQLRTAGLTLGAYIGGHIYYAQLAPNPSTVARVKKLGVARSMVAMRPEWKLHPSLTGTEFPLWATAAQGQLKVHIRFASNAPRSAIQSILQAKGVEVIRISETFDEVRCLASPEVLQQVAKLPWVLAIVPIDAPSVAYNLGGARLSRGQILARPVALGGRNLTGKGRKVGIWDGNVVTHPDFGNRIHRQEYENNVEGVEEHGTHVAGTVLGSGLMDIRGRGMAPEAIGYAYNFNVQRNGLQEYMEMDLARKLFGIHTTQNSFGVPMGQYCARLNLFTYFNADYNFDLLATRYPTLTHVFAAGNERLYCSKETEDLWGAAGYGTVTRKAKNIISVGAVNDYGELGNFSSFGPTDDGRIFPLICAKGVDVYSVAPGEGYQPMSGTSMACPTVSGHVLLLQERYAQLHNNAEIRSDLLRALVANTAEDAGRKGPDFAYGFGILNAEHAVQALEKDWFKEGEVEQQKVAEYTITVPSGVQKARIMLVWNDPAVWRDYTWGQSVLVNDLDLRVTAGSQTYEPWVLNPTKGHVLEEAKRGNDVRNNVEQVTLDATELQGATSLKVEVKGTRITNGKQPFALAWWLEGTPKGRVLSPAPNDQYKPGDDLVIHLEAIKAPFKVELSYDGGKNYIGLGEINEDYLDIYGRIPTDAPITQDAKLRVIEKAGAVVTSEGSFIIAPQVMNLKLEAPACGLENWKLTWDAVAATNVTYEIFVADTEKGRWNPIGESTATEFTIPADKLLKGKKPLFCVAVRVAEGVYGLHSTPVFAKTPIPLVISGTDLPFAETFKEGQQRSFYTLELGKLDTSFYLYNAVGGEPGSNVFYMGVNKPDKDGGEFNKDAWFDRSVNANYMCKLIFCNIDLSNHPEDVQLRLHGALVRQLKDVRETSRFRLLDNGTVLKNSDGEEIVKNTEKVANWYYVLKGGTTHKIEIEHCGINPRDQLGLLGVYLLPLQKELDVSLELAREVADSIQRQQTIFPFVVRNNASVLVPKAELRVYLNGKWVVSKPIANLQPRATAEIPVTLDLSTENPLGQLFDIRAEVILAGDTKPENNTLERKVQNLGEVVVHPFSKSMLGIPFDEKVIIDVNKPIVYTDNGGVFRNHPGVQRSTVKFLPTTPNTRLRVTFKNIHLAGNDSTYLSIYTTQVPESLMLGDAPYMDIVRGKLNEGEELVYVSDANDGGLTFFFRALDNAQESGWLATIDLVPISNPLTLLSAKAVHRGETATADIPVEFTVRNNYPEPQKDVLLSLYVPLALGYPSDLEIKEIPTGVSTFQLPPVKNVQQSSITDAMALIQYNGDSYGKDNICEIPLGYDKYPIPGLIGANDPYFWQIYINDSLYSVDGPQRNILYELSPAVLVYKDDKKVKLHIPLERNSDLESVVGAWIDWNNNAEFEAEEGTYVDVPVADDDTNLELEIPASIQPGQYRMRMAIYNPSAKVQAPNFEQGLAYGDIRDVTLEVRAQNPTTGDLELLAVEAGLSGSNLGSTQEVKITILNRSLHTYSNDLEVTLSVDGKMLPSETVKIEELASKASQEITLTKTTVDLSQQGKHIIIAKIAEKPAVVNEKNNTAQCQVYHLIPNTTGEQYCMAFKKPANGKKYQVALPYVAEELAQLKEGQILSFEMLFRAPRPELATLLQSSGFEVQIAHGLVDFPDNGLVFHIGNGAWVWTRKGVVTYASWHHLRFEVCIRSLPTADLQGETDINIWIDGKKCDVDVYGLDTPNFRDLVLGSNFNGEIDEFRCWNTSLKDNEVEEYMYKHRTGTGGTLPQNCIAEYNFDEGVGNWASVSAGRHAEIEVSDPTLVTKATDGIWRQQAELLGGFQFEGMVSAEKDASGKWLVTFMKRFETQKSTIKGNIYKNWLKSSFKYQGKELTENQLFDFSSEVTIDAEVTLFGKKYTQTIRFAFVADKSDECDILTLKLPMAANQGLKKEVTVATPIPSDCSIALKEAEEGHLVHRDKVKFEFTLSAGAELYLDKVDATQKITSAVTEIDCTKPHQFIVKAENGTLKRYIITLLHDQTITWTQTLTQQTYGAEQKELNAAASSKLPVVYSSSNPEVASVVDNRLVFGVPGSATIYAQQQGNALYSAAESKEKVVSVVRKEITLAPDITTKQSYGLPIAWKFACNGTLLPEEAQYFANPVQAQKLFKIEDAKAKEYSWDVILPVGAYQLKPRANYVTAYYELKLSGQNFEVVADKFVAIRFVVKQYDKQLVSGAQIVIGTKTYTTDAQGELQLPFEKGKKISYVASWGKLRAEGKYLPQDNATIEIVFPQADLTLTYHADAHSTISGDGLQQVAKGLNGSEVLVLPATGYHFEKWSDDVTDNPRRDVNVQKSLEVTAQCALNTYKVEYTIVGSGILKSGDAVQEVQHGKDAKAVEVAPQDDESVFEMWSDGSKNLMRTDANIEHATRFSAYFTAYATLPERQDFEGDGMPRGWYSYSKGEIDNPFVLARTMSNGSHALDGQFLLCNNNTLAIYSKKYISYIYTPRYRLNGMTADLQVHFDYTLLWGTKDPAQSDIEYTFDGTTWHSLKKGLEFGGRLAYNGTIEATEFANQSFIQFRIIYEPNEGFYFCFDNFQLFAAKSDKYTLTYKSVPEEAGEFEIDGNIANSQEVDHGMSAAPVLAKAKGAYRFVGWESGVKSAYLVDYRPVFASATYTAQFAKKEQVRISYSVNLPQAGSIQYEDGNPASYQLVNKGENARKVVAVENPGWHFLHWLHNGSEAKELDMKSVQEDWEVVAVFAKSEATLNFVVTSEEGVGVMAQIVLNGQLLQTDILGKASISLSEGTYKYSVTAEKYVLKNGAITMGAENKEEKVTLVRIPAVAPETVCEVTYTKPNNGTLTVKVGAIEIPTGTKLAVNTTLDIVVEPSEGYELDVLTINGAQTTVTNGMLQYKLTANTTIIATFKSKTNNSGSVEDGEFRELSVAPNPFVSLLKLSFNGSVGYRYKLLDVRGQEVRSGYLQEVETVIETTDLRQGIYLLHVISPRGTSKTLKVVKG